MPSTMSAPRKLDSRRANRFVRLHQLLLESGQSPDDVATGCGLTPPNLQNVVDSGGHTTERVLSRLEKYAALHGVNLPSAREELAARPPNGNGHHPGSTAPPPERPNGNRVAAARKASTRTPEAKATKHQHDEFHTICRELKSKYKLKTVDVLRITGYRSQNGFDYALRHGPKVWVYERAKFVRTALLAGTFTKESAIAEADRRWPVPTTGRRAPRTKKKAKSASKANGRATQEGVASPPTDAPSAEEAYRLPELADDVVERLVRGFATIERAGTELSRISEVLLGLATDPQMPMTVRKTAGEMVNGLTVHTLSALECAREETSSSPAARAP